MSTAIYCAFRIDGIESQRFLGVELDSDLAVVGSIDTQVFEATGFIKRGERLGAIDGTELAGIAQLLDLMRGKRHLPMRIVVEAPEETSRILLYWDAPRIPRLRTNDEMEIVWGEKPSAGLESIFANKRVLAVSGIAAGKDSLESSYQSHPWWLQFTIEDQESTESTEVLFWLADYKSPWALLLIGICFGGLGLTVHAIRSGTRSSTAFLWFSFGSALFYFSRSIPSDFRTELEHQLFGVLLCAMVVPTVHFVGTFTSLRLLYSRSKIYLRLSVGVAAALLLAWVSLDVISFLILWSGTLLAVLGTVLLGPSLLSLSIFNIPAPDLPRTHVIATVLGLSLGPSLGYLFFDSLVENGAITWISQSQLPARFWFDFPALFFPLTIGYMVIRRNLLQVNELLLEGATYGVLVLGLGGAFAAFVGFAVPIMETLRPGSSITMTAAGAGLVAWFGYPLFARSRRSLEDRFHQTLRGYDALASRLPDLGDESIDRGEFCRKFAPSLQALTRATSITIVLSERFSVPQVLSGGPPGTIGAEEARRLWKGIMNTESMGTRELQREELFDSVQGGSEARQLLDSLDALSLLFVFPLLGEGILQGVIGVSGKVDARNYSRAEVQKLRLVTRECALALYGFTIRENMKAKREAEENLRKSETKLREIQKLEAVATLAGGIAHDFHNLITAIFAFTAVAKETLPFDHPAADAIENVEEAARQASGITKSLLVFTQKERSERRPLDLAQFIPRALRFVESILPANIRAGCEIDNSMPLWVEADETQLHQIIMNLIVNSKDAMPGSGEISIRVATAAGESDLNGIHADQSFVTVEIRDTGSGMTEDVRRRAFDPFYTTKDRGQGTGLGLSIVQGIMKDHEGSIDLRSTPGHGTSIVLYFPMCPEAPADDRTVGVGRRSGSRGNRILIADDNDMVRMGLSTCLTREGFEVIQAVDGEAFCSAVANSDEKIDLAVLDMDMPGRNGFDCLDFLEREAIDIPVIVITGKASTRVERISYPNFILLEKPFGMPGFLRVVNERLSDGKPAQKPGSE